MHHHILHIVEKTFAKKKFQAKLSRYCQTNLPRWSPDIAISRDPGSGGRLIAQKLAKKLHWKLYDKTILKQLAQNTNLPSYLINSIDEHPRSKITDLFHAIFNPNYISDITYIQTLKKLILKAGKNEDVIFLGRGANFILPPSKILRVRITAPFSVRVKNTIKHEKLTRQQAIERVKKVEKARNEFIKQYFGVDPNDPTKFDLIINTTQLGINQAVSLIIHAFRRKFPHKKLKLS